MDGRSHTLINKRRLLLADYAAEKISRIGKEHRVVVAPVAVEIAVHLAEKPKLVELGGEQCREPPPEIILKHCGAERSYLRQNAFRRVLTLIESGAGIFGPFRHGFILLLHLKSAPGPRFEILPEGGTARCSQGLHQTAAAGREVCTLAREIALLGKRCGKTFEPRRVAEILVDFRAVKLVFLVVEARNLPEEIALQPRRLREKIGRRAALHFRPHEAHKPVLHIAAVGFLGLRGLRRLRHIDTLKHLAHGHSYGVGLVDFHGARGRQLKFARKRVEHTLEEGIDRADVEPREIEQEVFEGRSGMACKSLAVGAELLQEIIEMSAAVGVGTRIGQTREFADDAFGHFLGGLVGKGNSQNLAVGHRLATSGRRKLTQMVAAVGFAFSAEKMFEIATGELKRLARARRGFVDCQHTHKYNVFSSNRRTTNLPFVCIVNKTEGLPRAPEVRTARRRAGIPDFHTQRRHRHCRKTLI